MYEIKIYQDQNGRSEIEEYLKSLSIRKDKTSRIKYSKIIAYIRLLKQEGTRIGKPYVKHLMDDIWELRPLRDRILFAYYKDKEFVLLSVFIKRTQKTPRNEIIKAKKLLKDFLKRGTCYE